MLAQELHADQLLIDEADARKEAALRKLPFIGTLGILRKAARQNMIDLSKSLQQLQLTSFYVGPGIIKSLLDEESARQQGDHKKF
jgi:predicted nucleic acid-binding protein